MRAEKIGHGFKAVARKAHRAPPDMLGQAAGRRGRGRSAQPRAAIVSASISAMTA